MRLKGKTALITGGTSGIGEATVKLFVAEGARVVFTGRNAEKGKSLETDLGKAAKFFQSDVRKEADIIAAVAFANEHLGGLEIVFNNAGGVAPGTPENVSGDQFRHAMDLLVGSVVFGIREAAPIMRAAGRGAIINNASVSAFRGDMGEYLYAGAKAAVRQITRMAGLELGQHGITVNSVAPGGIATPIFFGGSQRAAAIGAEAEAEKMAKLEKNLAKATPLHRAGSPHDIATAVLFLASDEGRFVNCHDMVVDGGMTAGGRTRYE
jgi:NAD(P)-dependent dehydrogenase (short-subunit alcohol dehydrogenase family)